MRPGPKALPGYCLPAAKVCTAPGMPARTSPPPTHTHHHQQHHKHTHHHHHPHAHMPPGRQLTCTPHSRSTHAHATQSLHSRARHTAMRMCVRTCRMLHRSSMTKWNGNRRINSPGGSAILASAARASVSSSRVAMHSSGGCQSSATSHLGVAPSGDAGGADASAAPSAPASPPAVAAERSRPTDTRCESSALAATAAAPATTWVRHGRAARQCSTADVGVTCRMCSGGVLEGRTSRAGVGKGRA
mmetsp:Transcript_41390/g.123582  ORF Transcript_41390/g.123582 Transcript_41390/m.123582 type:complete len:245 (-) Transcript_41390:211-945(-)